MLHRIFLLVVLLVLVLAGCSAEARTARPEPAPSDSLQWYRGNLHTHSLWSDGDDYPEMIISWYKRQGYDFVAVSDHNTIADEQRWIPVPDTGAARRAFDQYRGRFGENWVNVRRRDGTREVRLKRFEEYSTLLQEPGRFLVIRSEEISDGYDGKPIHVNATNIHEHIDPQGGESVLEVMQNNVNAVLAQRERLGRDMFPHINHPNFVYAVTAEDLIALEGERFFEVYNGHPLVNNHGDDVHPSTERMWDIVLAHRLAQGRDMMYGLATDDAHHYHQSATDRANPGRGWVVVRAAELEPQAIVKAMERGEFYASTGVSLRDVRFAGDTLLVEIEGEPGITYETQFIGTRRGFDTRSEEQLDEEGRPVTRRYSDEIGGVLQATHGTEAAYVMQGDELYVRARIISSRAKADGHAPDERETAWTQPVRPAPNQP